MAYLICERFASINICPVRTSHDARRWEFRSLLYKRGQKIKKKKKKKRCGSPGVTPIRLLLKRARARRRAILPRALFSLLYVYTPWFSFSIPPGCLRILGNYRRARIYRNNNQAAVTYVVAATNVIYIQMRTLARIGELYPG